jgi:hypothetical protein
MNENKEVIVHFRLSYNESVLLSQLAQRENTDISKYLRAVIRNKKKAFTLSPEEVSFLKDSFSNITRLGSNINQITYHLNSKAAGGIQGENLVTKQSRNELENLLEETNKLVNKTKDKIIELINIA